MSVLAVAYRCLCNHILANTFRSAYEVLAACECAFLLIVVLGNSACSSKRNVVVGNAAESVEVGALAWLNEALAVVQPFCYCAVIGKAYLETLARYAVALDLQLALLGNSWQLTVLLLYECRVGYRHAAGVGVGVELELLLYYSVSALGPWAVVLHAKAECDDVFAVVLHLCSIRNAYVADFARSAVGQLQVAMLY